MNRRTGGVAVLAGAALLAGAAGACRRSSQEPLITYFNGDFNLSLRYPASWRTDQAEQDGMWYRYFLGPPTGTQRKPAVSVTLLAGPLGMPLEEYAQKYLAGNTLSSSRDETRDGARGKAYRFASADGATRHSLLLFQEGGRVFGLFSQADAPLFERHAPVIDEMERSLTPERPESYPEQRNDKLRFSIRVPPSWRPTGAISGSGTFVTQFTSPALAADRNRQTVHASLMLTIEPLPAATSVDGFHEAAREKLGDAYKVLSHTPWNGGFVDVLWVETPMATSRSKRFYRVAEGRGYTLAFEARDDAYPRVARWCDMIASTLKVGPEVGRP
ncbi:MAG: hypothetical protein DMF80_13805 [Acidobacteria bacterium]|nr:MAG: hypothetical protein DMF80_13805 [Acidobacteriota bacterium]PYQ18880.1 MAG: hypothetical protein DMF81_23595 [Acidobacteriota bacterium]